MVADLISGCVRARSIGARIRANEFCSITKLTIEYFDQAIRPRQRIKETCQVRAILGIDFI